jgi:GT2 family glycosyltransferase
MVGALDSPLLRRVEEPIAGLSRARNRGLVEARTQLVAFTDDDVRLDAGWVRGMTRGFTRAPRVGCVTGIVATAELETPAQAFFDARVHWAEGMHPRLFDLGPNRPDDPFFPYAAGTFGTGASMALDRRAVAEIGLFDEALGMGTPAENGEDLDMFLRVIAGGWTLAYEPAAIAWHSHRRDRAQLRRQMYTYGVGLSAYAFKHACRPRRGADMARRAPAALVRLARDALAAERVDSGTRGIAGVELRGLVGGPAGYIRGRRRLRRRDAVTLTVP